MTTPAYSSTGQDDIVIESGENHENGEQRTGVENGLPNEMQLFVRIDNNDRSDVGSNKSSRVTFASKREFLLSCIAMSVGLGNVWRFPFTAMRNGGGAFLIPYLIVLVFVGRPVYFLELAMGQFASSGHVKIWKMFPLFKGVGISAAFVTFCVISYYYSIMASALFYLFSSFRATLPWTECQDDWPDVDTCFSNGSALVLKNSSDPFSLQNASVPSLFYKHEVLHEVTQIDDGIGLPEWRLTLCLLAFWLIIFGSVVKGVKSSGKVSYVTALFPYVCLIVMLIRGLMLPGSIDGIVHFFKPNWWALLDPKVWIAAIDQCFFSLSTGFGPVFVYASYNPFDHDIYKDAMILSVIDTFTSLLSGCTVFAVLGYLSLELGVPIANVSEGSSALAFDTYPLVISKFGWAPQFFAVLFFLMLFTLGTGSGVADAGSIMTVLQDQFPGVKKLKIRAAVCIAGFLSGLIYLTPGGQFIFELVDHYGCMMVITVIVCLEVIGIAWCYGLSNVVRDIEFMLQRKLGIYLKICWGFIVPVGISVCMIQYIVTAKGLVGGPVQYPPAAIYCGRILTTIGLLIMPVCAIHTVLTRSGNNLIEKLKESIRPTSNWGPRIADNYRKWYALPQPESYWTKLKNLHKKVIDKTNLFAK